MPLVDQYEFAARVERLVNLERPLLDDDAAKRKETLACLKQAREHLGLEQALTKDEYERVQKELGLGWSWQRIHRLWGSFALAARAAGGSVLPTTWQQRDFQRRYVQPRTGDIEEPLSAVRAWLATEPATLTRKSYDEFACQHNLNLPEGGMPLPRAPLLSSRLGLSFAAILAVARGEEPLPEVQSHARDNKDWSDGPDDLVSIGTVALMAGVSASAVRVMARDPHARFWSSLAAGCGCARRCRGSLMASGRRWGSSGGCTSATCRPTRRPSCSPWRCRP